MSNLGLVLQIMVSAFVVGALARFAIPGPDPMPAWLTVSIGLVGSVVGGAIGAAASGNDPYGVSVGSFVTAVALVIAYRKFVQHRPIFGHEALRYLRRGVGVQEYRERLARAGVNPDALLDRALDEKRRREEALREPDESRDDDSQRPPEDKDDPSASAS